MQVALRPQAVALLAVAVTLATVSAAHAAERTLLLSSGKATFTSAGGASKFVSKAGLEIKCTSSVGSGSQETGTLGTVSLTFKGCVGALGAKCTGLADESGNVTFAGQLHYVLLLTKAAGIAILASTVHVTCAGILSIVRGCLVGSITPTNETTTTATASFKQSKAVNEFTDYFQAGSEEKETVECFLETSINGGKFEQSGKETTESITFNEQVELMN